jgi:hypothetical protein
MLTGVRKSHAKPNDAKGDREWTRKDAKKKRQTNRKWTLRRARLRRASRRFTRIRRCRVERCPASSVAKAMEDKCEADLAA